MSGMDGQGGIEVFSTYLLILGCLHSGHSGHAGCRLDGRGLSHPQGDGFPQLLQESLSFWKPSVFSHFEKNNPTAKPITKIPAI